MEEEIFEAGAVVCDVGPFEDIDGQPMMAWSVKRV